MKKLFASIVLYFLVTSYALSFENIITSLITNDDSEQEIEVVVSGDKMFLPCKYMLSILDIPFKENHVEKSLTAKNTVIKNNAIYIDGVKQNYQIYFQKKGVSGLMNEYFVPAEALSKITNENITSDFTQLTAFLTSKKFENVASNSDENKNPFISAETKIVPKAYQEITVPNKKGWISLDSMAFNNNMMSDSYSQVYRAQQSSNNFLFNNNTRVSLNGKLHTGTYKLDMGTNSYTSNLFSFSGISPQYKNRLGDYDYILGKADSWNFGQSSVGGDVLGVQIKDHVDKINGYQDIQGSVNPTSTIKAYLNDDFEKELSTYGGYYSLKDANYNGNVSKVRIEELLADGSKKNILTREFNERTKKQIPKNDIILGLSGTQNRLWASNGYIYQANTQKFVAGGKYRNEISDKLSFENFFLTDKIIAMPQNSTWGQSILGNRKYLNFTTMRNLNMLEGQTYMGSFNYKHNNPKLESKLYFGASNSMAKDTITKDGSGTCLSYENMYKFNDENYLKSSIFHNSPQFYSAGSASGSGGMLSDRAGASINGSTKIKNTTITGNYSKYNSNMGHYYDGGLLGVDEYNFISRTTFKKLPDITLKTNAKTGSNQLAQIQSGSYEISGSKKIKAVGFNAGIRKNNYSNQYNSNDYSSYKSSYSNTFANLNTPIGKRFGSANLEHEIIETKSDTTMETYNTIRVGYSTPTIKTVNLNFITGYRYSGINKGLDFGWGIVKRLQSGSAVSVNYRFNRSPGYIIDNMFLPSTMRHSITLDFSELYGISDNKLQALGSNNANKGFVEATAFLDANKNGIQDKDEINIENVTIKIKGESEVLTTDKYGHTKLKTKDAGIHQIQIFEDELPTLVSVHNKTNPCRIIKVAQNEKTEVSFGLISSVGNINGTIAIKDEFNQQLKVEDFVISLFDEAGNEVCYTNPEKDGSFAISGLSPGKYKIGIDKEFQNNFHIYPDDATSNLCIEIPPEYKKYVDIDNVNLTYIYKP